MTPASVAGSPARNSGAAPVRGPRVLAVATDEVGVVAARIVADHVRSHPTGVLGVATGASPLRLYAALAGLRAEGLVTEGLTLAALDEYVGVDPGDERSYHSYVVRHVAEPLGIPGSRVLVPRGGTQRDAERYEATLRGLGGVGLQVVGIGRNGHVGFNEPGSSRDSRTRVVALSDDTRAANAGYFAGDADRVPARAITQGIATILSASTIVMVASGAAKAWALDAALRGPVTADVPASFLQTHPAVTVVADDEALRPAS
ncbi:glucosamine-6-phosphate deaminase [Antribacter sp. KLBMP9083]|uniref:Glucosamine-6-phosphate deaminase n=1 Tax=Antribacter soli TaxID=2910976 RepID=A0AA41QBY5_9MICO|nr:glucosamine-6-phosphate deaminase [Antribacter soli]MCF4119796.1 glucosamine-6-phosphate deaminase [Antribacter soli]